MLSKLLPLFALLIVCAAESNGLSLLMKYGNYAVLGMLILALGVYIIRRLPKMMCFGAIVIQIAATAGLVYSWTHKSASGGFDPKTREWTYFSSNPRQQYSLEGIFMASLIASTGCALFFAIVCLNSKFLRKNGFSEIGAALFFFAAWSCYSYVLDVYMWKAPWYRPSFWPGPNAKAGPLSNDRGNIF